MLLFFNLLGCKGAQMYLKCNYTKKVGLNDINDRLVIPSCVAADMDRPRENVLYSPRGEVDSYGRALIRQTTTLEMVKKTFFECIDFILPGPDETITIGDYGAATGTRTMQLFNDVIGFIKKRHGHNRQIVFVYNDLPSNDFNGLFKRLAGYIPGAESYLKTFGGVFSLATGKTFYQQVMPANSMDIVFSSFALHYLSRRPCNVRNGLTVMKYGSEAELQKFQNVAEDDWKSFLFHRAIELKPGGYLLLIISMHCPEDCESEVEWQTVWTDALTELLRRDVISETEYVAATFCFYLRTEEEIRLPFDKKLECTRDLELLSIDKIPIVYIKYSKEHEDEYSWNQFADNFVDGSMALLHSSIYDALSDDRTVQNKAEVMERYKNEMMNCLRANMLDSFKFYSGAVVIRKKQT